MSTLGELLSAGGAPARLVEPVHAGLGDAAVDVLRADPWRLLDIRGVTPEQSDAFARALEGAAAQPDEPRRLTALTTWLLRRAAADGHTAMLVPTVLSALGSWGGRSADAERLVQDGRIVLAGSMLALRPAAELEEALAESLSMLADSEPPPAPGLPERGLLAVVGPAATARRAYVSELSAAAEAAGLRVGRASGAGLAGRAGVLAASDVAVVEDAELLGMRDAANLLDQLADGQRLVLVGDPALLPSASPGQLFADVLAAGLPAVTLPVSADGPRDRLLQEVRAGRLPPVEDPTRSVVVVRSDDAGAVRRTVQLVTDSIPRALAIPSDEVLVVTARRAGIAGASALDMALASALDSAGTRPRAVTIHEATGRRSAAVVVVLAAEAAGSLSRPLVATAFGLADQHLSVVHACGPALAEAVTRVPGRSRITRLAGLVKAHAGMLAGAV